MFLRILLPYGDTVPFVKPGDLVLVTEALNVPTAVSTAYDPVNANVPKGTMGVITADKGSGVYAVITGLGLVQIHTQHLKRLGMSIPEWMKND